MKLWFLNLEERFKDLPEVRARRFPSRFRVPPAGEAARHVFPDGESGPNMDTCPSMTFVFISHLLDDPDLFHKKAGAGAGQTGAGASDTEILARGAAADDIHRRELCPVQLCDVPYMDHVGEMVFRHLNGKGFDLAGPEGFDPRPDRREGKAADAIKEASHGQHSHAPYFGATAWATFRVMLMAD